MCKKVISNNGGWLTKVQKCARSFRKAAAAEKRYIQTDCWRRCRERDPDPTTTTATHC